MKLKINFNVQHVQSHTLVQYSKTHTMYIIELTVLAIMTCSDSGICLNRDFTSSNIWFGSEDRSMGMSLLRGSFEESEETERRGEGPLMLSGT